MNECIIYIYICGYIYCDFAANFACLCIVFWMITTSCGYLELPAGEHIWLAARGCGPRLLLCRARVPCVTLVCVRCSHRKELVTRSGGRQIGGPGVLSFSSFWFFSLLERLGLAPVFGIRSNTGSGAATARKTF
jgi:hypothetical protein